MKMFKLKRIIALLVSAVAMFIANTSSSMCYWLMWDEVKMPESIYTN